MDKLIRDCKFSEKKILDPIEIKQLKKNEKAPPFGGFIIDTTLYKNDDQYVHLPRTPIDEYSKRSIYYPPLLLNTLNVPKEAIFDIESFWNKEKKYHENLDSKKKLEMKLQHKNIGEDYILLDFPKKHFIPTAFWRFFYVIKTGYQIEGNDIYLPVFVLLSDENMDGMTQKVRNKDLFKFTHNNESYGVETFLVKDSEDFSVTAEIRFNTEKMKPKIIDENFKNIIIKKQILELP